MKRAAFVCACASALALLVGAYASSRDNSFHFDDSHVIETNLYIRSLAYVPRYFTDAHTFSSLPQNATYRPLVTLSLALDYARGGLDPRPFHDTQIALLILTGVLLAAFFTPLVGRWAALFAATLFCVHTGNTETMNLLSARSELLSGLGLLASFRLFQRSPGARRRLLYLVPLALGALAKAPVVVFAPLVFAYAVLVEKQSWRRAVRTALPSLVLGVVLLAVLDRMNAPEWQSGGGSQWHYAITQPFVWVHYARLFFLPIGLTADTDWTTFAHVYDTRAVVGFAFVVLLAMAIRRAARAHEGAVAFGLAWFAIALVPTSALPLAEVANEHRIFFAYMGAVLALVAWLAPRTAALPRETVALGAAVVLLLHALGTHERNEVWRSESTLWADVVSKSPANGRGWMNYGLTKLARGDYAGAKSDFARAATLTPSYPTLEINQGIVEGELGDQKAAERHFRRALELQPDANAHFFFARWLVGRGRASEAVAHVAEAVRLSPGLADARELATRLAVAGGAQPGHAWPDYASAFAAGLRADARHDWLAAAEADRDALRHDPRSADAHNNLGWSLAQLGWREQAASEYARALALRPHDERAANNLRLLRGDLQ